MAEADVLYFPLPFEARYASFSRFSLSTKLVSYLGSGVPILYHGPRDAAAGRVLGKHGAAVMASSLGMEAVADGLLTPAATWHETGKNALRLARSSFMLPEQQATFWKMFPHRAGRTHAASTPRSD